MKKETRFSSKCDRFIKLLVQLFPFIGVIICIFTFCGDNFNFTYDSFSSMLNEFTTISINTFLRTFYQGLRDSLYLNSTFDTLINDFNSYIGNSGITKFILSYAFYLCFIEIIWLFKNVLCFLPRVGNYFITKWGGD